jgi:predicted HTH domain antitoxin
MKTSTLSVRLDPAEVRLIDRVARRDGVDRSTLLKRFVRRGHADYLFETACERYRRGEVSLSRAAELAELGLTDFIARLPQVDLHLNLKAADLKDELTF